MLLSDDNNMADSILEQLHSILNELRDLKLALDSHAIVAVTDIDGTITFVNDKFCEVSGYERSELIGNNHRILKSGHHPPEFFEQMYATISAGKIWTAEICNRNKAGELYWALTTIKPFLDNDGKPLKYVAIRTDITERKRNEEEIKKAERYSRNLIEASLDPLVTIGFDGKITSANKAVELATGFSREDLIGSDFCDCFLELHEAREVYQKVFEQGSVVDYPLTMRHTSGSTLDVLYNATVYYDENGEIEGIFAAARDITERKVMENRIKHLAFYDQLTNLPNRRKLYERLEASVVLSKREGKKFVIFVMDLDKFKAVNDTLGHAAGDDLLKQVALRITDCLRESDMVARLGGDEFVVLLENVEQREYAAQVANKIIAALTVPFELSDGNTVQIGASIGISLYPEHEENYERLISLADMALYKAKENGRGCCVFYGEN